MTTTFTNKDFNSSDGMMTSIWGPPLWHFLHTMSFNYPVKPTKKQKTDYHNFISNLQNILPCGHCRNNLSKNLINAKLTKTVFNNRENFSKFIYRLHNTVNQMLGKKCKLTYNQVRDRYENFRSRCLNKSNKRKYEDGCVEPLHGEKSKCILQVVPKSSKKRSWSMSNKCKLKKCICDLNTT